MPSLRLCNPIPVPLAELCLVGRRHPGPVTSPFFGQPCLLRVGVTALFAKRAQGVTNDTHSTRSNVRRILASDCIDASGQPPSSKLWSFDYVVSSRRITCKRRKNFIGSTRCALLPFDRSLYLLLYSEHNEMRKREIDRKTHPYSQQFCRYRGEPRDNDYECRGVGNYAGDS